MGMDRHYKREAESFKDHVAKYTVFKNEHGKEIEQIQFGKPGTGNYFIKYWFKDGILCVSGDLGDAVYNWHHSIGKLINFDVCLSYMMGKCVASEVGRRFVQWSDEDALDDLKEHIDQYHNDEPERYKTWEEFKKSFIDEYDIDGYPEFEASLENQHDWVEWIRDNEDKVVKWFGQDYWEFLYDIGNVTHIRAYLHWKGLCLALEQLKANH
jgi:hypothetical protein